MLSNKVLRKVIEDLNVITRVEFCIVNAKGEICVSTFDTKDIKEVYVKQFLESAAEIQIIEGCNFFKVQEHNNISYLVITNGSSQDSYTMGKVCVSQIKNLLTAYKERFDENGFIQNLLLDNMLLVDIYNRAKSLDIENNTNRVIMLVQTPKNKEANALDMIKNIFAENTRDFITAIDENSIIIVKDLENSQDYQEVDEVANILVDMFNTEIMVKAKVSYGTIVKDLKHLSKSYKEAKMSMEVGEIFYAEKNIISYDSLGIGRLIYQLPINLCEIFIDEVFKEETPDSLDEETIMTIYKFFENHLNISETARKLYIHRNTLVYRLDKIQKLTGLDVKKFDDAVAFKLALMVVNYMKYINSRDKYLNK